MSDLFAEPSTTTFDLRAGDCLAGMAALAAESVDLVVTSPPYNLDIAYASYRDDAPRVDYLDWCYRWAAEVRRVLKPGGSFFLNIGAAPANPLLPHEIVLKLQPLFRLQNTIHWIKSITVQPRRAPELSVGHFKPINSKRYLTDCHEYVFHLTKLGLVQLDRLAVGVEYADKSNIARWAHTRGEARDRRCRGNNWFIPYETINSKRYLTDCHEYVFHLTKTGDVPLDRLGVGVEYADKTNIARWAHTRGEARDRRCRGNNWFIPYETIKSRADDRPHPATFPTQLAEWCIRLHGARPDLVMLDPFLGLGHSATAAATCGVGKFIGFEIDDGYLAEARGRLDAKS